MKNFKFFFLLFFIIPLISPPGKASAQVVYDPITNNSVYEYLDEMATLKLIRLNSIVKPYSRQLIADKLLEIKKNDVSLNKRQKGELTFYLREYKLELGIRNEESGIELGIKNEELGIELRIKNEELGIKQNGTSVDSPIQRTVTNVQQPSTGDPKPVTSNKRQITNAQRPATVGFDPISFNFANKWLRLSIRPLLGAEFIGNENGMAGTVTGGGNVFGYLGKHVGIYASVVQRFQSESLVMPEYFTLRNGYNWKTGNNGNVVNTEFTGGITYSWSWGDIGVYQDRFSWGSGIHGANIFAGRAPAFPFIRFHLKPAKWIEFSYIHGWLKSNVIDSLNVQEHKGSGVHYINKFIAANILTFTPWKGLDISFGNSAVYSSENVQAAYLIPFMFYPAVGATLSLDNNIQDNYQMFFEISSRNLKHLQMFVTLYIDEFKTSRISDPNTFNFLCWKGGFRVWDFPINNLSFSAEFYQSNAGTYQHYIPALQYTSDEYCLGDYLRENSREIYASLAYKPIRGLTVSTWFNSSIHGEDTQYSMKLYPDRIRPLVNPSWKNTSFGVGATWEFVNRGTVSFQYEYNQHYGNMARLPALYRGKTNSFTVSLGLGI